MTTDILNTIPAHQPVMVSEVMSHLVTDPNGIYIDGTIGLGGHSKAILSSLNKGGHLIGIDRDEEALDIAEKNLKLIGNNYSTFNQSYAETDLIGKKYGLQTISGILLDLGLSSAQLNDQARGFTFNGSGSLDMRFNTQSGNAAIRRMFYLLYEHQKYIVISMSSRRNAPDRARQYARDCLRIMDRFRKTGHPLF